MWTFCLRSLVREYGWLFTRRVAVRHPWRTLKAFREAGSLDAAGDGFEVFDEPAAGQTAGPPSIVGAGFCLKPMDPPCPSGRFNHDCVCLERSAGADGAAVRVPCRSCAIRGIGMQALRAGSAFYVMTSARDILDDVFVPAMAQKTFSTGLFVLCRYSFQPFLFGMRSSGMRGRLIPLAQGDCRDYRTWLLADRGIKDEQTTLNASGMASVANRVQAPASSRALRVERQGNVLFPVTAGPAA